jgi:histidyl-tRNA synthetase
MTRSRMREFYHRILTLYPMLSDADFDEDRSSDPNVGVASVAAGGRYDNLF